MRRGEEDARVPTVVDAEDRRRPGADVVQDDPDVVGEDLDRRQILRAVAVREARATPVDHDQTGE